MCPAATVGHMQLRTLAALATVVLAACSPSEQGPLAEPPAGFSAELLQYTFDVVNEDVVVKVRNTSDRSFTVRTLEVLAPGFDGIGSVDFGTVVPPGRAFDLRLPYGAPACERSGSGPVRLRMEFTGTDEPVVVEAGNGEVLHRVYEQTCAAEEAAEAVPMRWAGDWRVRGTGRTAVVVGTLEVGPVAADDVALAGINPTTQFQLTLQEPPVLQAGDRVRVPVELRPSRCDAHAVGESHQGFLFLVRLRFLAEDREALVPVVPDEADRPLLTGYLLERCGLQSSSGR